MEILTFEQLTEEEKKAAIAADTTSLLKAIIEGMRFNDELNGDFFQARIDRAIQKAEDNRTPWFAHEYIMEDASCKEQIEGMARCSAMDSLYSVPGVVVVSGIAKAR